jgi:hypothetical protein
MTQQSPGSLNTRHRKNILLNTLLVLLSLVIIALVADLLISDKSPKAAKPQPELTAESSIAPQIEILNGCGISGVGQKMTSALRGYGFDVVEMRNYKTFDVKESFIIDRSGDLGLARRLADHLGIRQKNIVQQINPDYFVASSIVIGKDFKTLRPWQ